MYLCLLCLPAEQAVPLTIGRGRQYPVYQWPFYVACRQWASGNAHPFITSWRLGMLGLGKTPQEEMSQTAVTKENYPSTSSSPEQPSETYPRATIDTPPAQRAMTESETIAREIKDGTLSGFVSSGTFVSGEAKFKAMLRIDGRFSGRITSSDGELIIGAGGRVDANVEVSAVTVQGIVNGDLIASRRVELGRAARVIGNIQTPSLMMEKGAIFEGNCKMTQQSIKGEKAVEAKPKHHLPDPSKAKVVTTGTSNRETDTSSSKDQVIGIAAAS
jgi:cytoskeletal protein CcmA (bactofilin family)